LTFWGVAAVMVGPGLAMFVPHVHAMGLGRRVGGHMGGQIRCGRSKSPASPQVRVLDGAPGGTRTPNQPGRNRLLYPLSYGRLAPTDRGVSAIVPCRAPVAVHSLSLGDRIHRRHGQVGAGVVGGAERRAGRTGKAGPEPRGDRDAVNGHARRQPGQRRHAPTDHGRAGRQLPARRQQRLLRQANPAVRRAHDLPHGLGLASARRERGRLGAQGSTRRGGRSAAPARVRARRAEGHRDRGRRRPCGSDVLAHAPAVGEIEAVIPLQAAEPGWLAPGLDVPSGASGYGLADEPAA
jgi:hypothetical protein